MSNRLTTSGRSRPTMCPAPGMMANSASGIARAISIVCSVRIESNWPASTRVRVRIEASDAAGICGCVLPQTGHLLDHFVGRRRTLRCQSFVGRHDVHLLDRTVIGGGLLLVVVDRARPDRDSH